MQVVKMQRVAVDGALERVRFDEAGRVLAVVTELGVVTAFDCSRNCSEIATFKTGLQACELAFLPEGKTLVVTGVRQRAAVEGVVQVYAFPPASKPKVVAVFDTMATAPTWLPDRRVLMVGAYLRLVCLDGSTFKELAAADGDDYVAPRGIAALSDGGGCVAVWGRQGSARLEWYEFSAASELVSRGKRSPPEPEPLGGIAVSPSGTYTVATFARPDAFKPPARSQLKEGPYGHVSVYDNATRALVARHEIPGSLTEDFVPYGGQGRKASFGAEVPPTEPVFLDDDRVVYGMPGGQVRVIDLPKGNVSSTWRVESGLRRLAYSAAAGLLAAGGADGSVHVWRP